MHYALPAFFTDAEHEGSWGKHRCALINRFSQFCGKERWRTFSQSHAEVADYCSNDRWLQKWKSTRQHNSLFILRLLAAQNWKPYTHRVVWYQHNLRDSSCWSPYAVNCRQPIPHARYYHSMPRDVLLSWNEKYATPQFHRSCKMNLVSANKGAIARALSQRIDEKIVRHKSEQIPHIGSLWNCLAAMRHRPYIIVWTELTWAYPLMAIIIINKCI